MTAASVLSPSYTGTYDTRPETSKSVHTYMFLQEMVAKVTVFLELSISEIEQKQQLCPRSKNPNSQIAFPK